MRFFPPARAAAAKIPLVSRALSSEQTRRGGGCVCWLPSANSGSCSCHSVTATCPGPGAAPRAPWPPASMWPPPSATLGVSSRAASQNQGPNCCAIRVGKLRQGVAKRRAQKDSAQQDSVGSGCFGFGVMCWWCFPKPKLRSWGRAEPTGLVRMRVGVAEAMLTVCSTPGWLIPALTTFPVT